MHSLSKCRDICNIVVGNEGGCLGASLKVIGRRGTALLPIGRIGSVSKTLRGGPGRNFFVLCCCNVDFGKLSSTNIPRPLFYSLTFDGPYVTIGKQGTILKYGSKLFLFSNGSNLLPVSVRGRRVSCTLCVVLSVTILLSTFLTLFLLGEQGGKAQGTLVSGGKVGPSSIKVG